MSTGLVSVAHLPPLQSKASDLANPSWRWAAFQGQLLLRQAGGGLADSHPLGAEDGAIGSVCM